jgi:penicillin-binding protein 2
MRRLRDRSERRGTFNRRSLLLAGGGAVAFGALTARLWQLQVVDAEQYATRAVENQFNYVPIPPSRGRILDRYGAVIAGNHENYLVRFTAHQAGGPTERRAVLLDLARVLAPNASLDRWNALVESWTTKISRARRYDEVLLESDLDWATFSRVNLRLPSLPGVTVDTGETRAYGIETATAGVRRDADAFAHVVGYVSKPNDEAIADRLDGVRDVQERAGLSRVLRHPGYRIGRAGLELTLDAELQGVWGLNQVEVDARGRVIREKGVVQAAVPGGDARLTLDAEVQAYAQHRLAGESGAVVALDVSTGEIVCLVSAPAFDPNRFARGIPTAAYRALVNDERKPLYNKPLAGLYPPGSTYKVITALAALRAGVIDPEERISCRGVTRLGNAEFHCWRGPNRGGHGLLDLRGGIKNSCDCYFYEVSRRVGIDRISAEARLFGVEEDFALDAPGARPGLAPTEAWKRSRYDEGWAGGDTLVAGIGQGYVLTSPLELAVLTARIANGGRAIRPYVVAGRPAEQPAVDGPPLADPEHVALVKDAMMAVTDEVGGTAYSALQYKGIDIEGVRMAGKTGSSQVRRITPEERARGVIGNDDLPWRRRDHGLFIAFAPYDAPRYAIALIVEHGGGGSVAAARPARDILREILLRDPTRLADAGEGAQG